MKPTQRKEMLKPQVAPVAILPPELRSSSAYRPPTCPHQPRNKWPLQRLPSTIPAPANHLLDVSPICDFLILPTDPTLTQTLSLRAASSVSRLQPPKTQPLTTAHLTSRPGGEEKASKPSTLCSHTASAGGSNQRWPQGSGPPLPVYIHTPLPVIQMQSRYCWEGILQV